MRSHLLTLLGTTALLLAPAAADAHPGGGHGGGYHGGYHGGHYGYYGHPGYHGYHGYYGRGYYPYYGGLGFGLGFGLGLGAGLYWPYGYYRPYGYYGPYAPYPVVVNVVGSSPGGSSPPPPAPAATTAGATPAPADAPPQDNAAHLKLLVPAGARVWFDGDEVRQSGTEREFVSPPLTPGKRYAYRVRVRWADGGRDHDETRTLYVRANDWFLVDFTRPAPPDVPPAPFPAEVK